MAWSLDWFMHSFICMLALHLNTVDCLLHNLSFHLSCWDLRNKLTWDHMANWSWVRSHLSQFLTFHQIHHEILMFGAKSMDFHVNPQVKSSDFMDFINSQLNPQIFIVKSLDFTEIPGFILNGSDHHSLYSFKTTPSIFQF